MKSNNLSRKPVATDFRAHRPVNDPPKERPPPPQKDPPDGDAPVKEPPEEIPEGS